MRAIFGVFVVSLLIASSVLFADAGEVSGGSNPCIRDQIDNLDGRHSVPVYAAPGREYLQVGELTKEDVVYSCDETYEWTNVLFSSLDGPCDENLAVKPRIGEEVQIDRLLSCKSAWVEREFVVYLGKLPELPEESSLCNLGRVDYLEDGHSAPVYAAPAIGHLQIAELKNGDVVYICTGGGEWMNVFFSSPGGPCNNVVGNNGLAIDIARTCKTGWVDRKFVNVVSG